MLTLSLHKQHIRLYFKGFGKRLCVDWSNYYKIQPLMVSNEHVFFVMLFTFQESR
jgi:hypothetical protein